MQTMQKIIHEKVASPFSQQIPPGKLLNLMSDTKLLKIKMANFIEKELPPNS